MAKKGKKNKGAGQVDALAASPEPGVGKPTYPDVEEAANKYRGIRSQRTNLIAHERGAKEDLLEAMAEHGVEAYTFDDVVVKVESKKKVSVMTVKNGLDREAETEPLEETTDEANT